VFRYKLRWNLTSTQVTSASKLVSVIASGSLTGVVTWVLLVLAKTYKRGGGLIAPSTLL
jgi:hypothetical protein